MKLAAILIGVVAGLAGLYLALVGEALLTTIGGGSAASEPVPPLIRALFYGPPAAMLLGAIATAWWRIAGGVLLLAGAASWLAMGPNIATLGPIVLGAVAGILALLSARRTRAPAQTS